MTDPNYWGPGGYDETGYPPPRYIPGYQNISWSSLGPPDMSAPYPGPPNLPAVPATPGDSQFTWPSSGPPSMPSSPHQQREWSGDPFPYTQPPPASQDFEPPSETDSGNYLNETSVGDGEGNFPPALPGDAPLGTGQMWPAPGGTTPYPGNPVYPPYGNNWGWNTPPPPWDSLGTGPEVRR